MAPGRGLPAEALAKSGRAGCGSVWSTGLWEYRGIARDCAYSRGGKPVLPSRTTLCLQPDSGPTAQSPALFDKVPPIAPPRRTVQPASARKPITLPAIGIALHSRPQPHPHQEGMGTCHPVTGSTHGAQKRNKQGDHDHGQKQHNHAKNMASRRSPSRYHAVLSTPAPLPCQLRITQKSPGI